MFKVKFVAHSNTKQGSTPIRVVGNLPQLGNWNPYNGFQMEEYYDGEWQSIKHLEIPNGQQFQFKLVKLNDKNGVQWQEMPNNSNRKFKPKFHTKLILKWSNHIGKVLNQAKSSLKFKGLPGVMMHGKKQAGMLKRNPKNRHILSDSDSQQQNQNDSFCVGRKKSTDIRQSINSDDIQQIYYDTTDLQKAYQHYKQTQVHLISSCADLHKQFITKIEQQLKQLHELQNFKFKWLLLTNDQANLIKFKKTSFKKIQKYNDDKIYLDQYNSHTNQKNHFIFVDLDAALRAVVGNSSACLYLPSVEFQKVIKFLNQLEQFQFICFDNQDKNKQLLKLFQEKRSQTQISQFQTQKQKQNSIQNMPKQNLLKKQEQSKSQKNFTTATMSIQKILQQLQFCHHSQSSVNTVHSFTKKQSLANILQANSILIIDSQLMKIDKKYFDSLLDTQFEKRFIMIIHKIGIPQWIQLYSEHKNICVILDNYTKFYFVGKMYDPSKKHRDAIDFIKMRAKLFEKQIGGQWRIQQNSFTFYFKPGTTTKAHNIKSQIQNVLMKDYDYFKFYIKQNRLKIVWNLSHTVRLFRTLVRIKSMQQGQIGNFFIVSVNQNFNQIKQQLKLLINTNSNLMLDGKNTRIFYYGFGSQSNAKYSIKNQNITNQSTSSTSSSLSTLSEIGIEKQKVKKFVQIQQKYSENKKQTTQI